MRIYKCRFNLVIGVLILLAGKGLYIRCACLAQSPAPEDPGASTNMAGAPDRSQSLLEQQMYTLVNRDRADPANAPETRGHALPLRWNERLAAVARAHSLDMLDHAYFGHEDPQGRPMTARIEAAGMAWQSVGENIAIYGSVAPAEAAFMNEPHFSANHRANILNSNFTDIGIGIVQASDGRLYITQDFFTGFSQP